MADKKDDFDKERLERILYDLRYEISQLLHEDIIHQSYCKSQPIGYTKHSETIIAVFEYKLIDREAWRKGQNFNFTDMIYREIAENVEIKYDIENLSVNDEADIATVEWSNACLSYRERQMRRIYKNYSSCVKLNRANYLVSKLFYEVTRAYHSEYITETYRTGSIDEGFDGYRGPRSNRHRKGLHLITFEVLILDNSVQNSIKSFELFRFNNDEIKEIDHDQEKSPHRDKESLRERLKNCERSHKNII